MKRRQALRRGLGLASFLLFPITIFYFSPVLPIFGASMGLAAGSLLVFAALFFFSLFLGRAFCGWLCPSGAYQDMLRGVRDRRLRARRIGFVKFLVWVPWLATLVIVILRAGGIHRVEFLFGTHGGVSVMDWTGYIVYFSVLAAFGLPALIVGRRAGCHTVCWVSPFMVIGRRLRNVFGWPALQLSPSPAACIGCGLCDSACPMGVEPMELVKAGRLESLDCILCGACVGRCPKGAVRFAFATAKPAVGTVRQRRPV